jgi:hypothetical protein
MDVVTLNSQLTKFYVEVRQENGEKYKKSRLIAIRKIIVNLNTLQPHPSPPDLSLPLINFKYLLYTMPF